MKLDISMEFEPENLEKHFLRAHRAHTGNKLGTCLGLIAQIRIK